MRDRRYYTPLQALSDEQAGKFFRKICNCLEGKQTESDGKDTPEFEPYLYFDVRVSFSFL